MKARTSGAVVVAALAVVGVAILCFSRTAAVEAAYPAEKFSRTFSRKVWSRIRGAWNGSAAMAENVRLRREVDSLALARGDVERLETENARLRAALDYAAKAPGRWLAAGVLAGGGPAAGTGRTLRLDKGTSAGVREGAVVMVPEGLVGRVRSVTPHTSDVLLLGDPSVKVACELELDLDGGRLKGVIGGGDDSVLVMRHLSGRADVPVRARVLTSGLGGVFPKGLEIGRFLGVFTNRLSSALEAEVLPSVDFESLEDVFIRCEK